MMAVADILQSPARIFYAAVGTALPSANTVGYGAAWTAPWVDLGYTLNPITVSYSKEIFKLSVEQVTLPIAGTTTDEEVTIETTLAEITAANLMLAFGGSIGTTAAGTAQVALEELKSGGSSALTYYAWGIEGLYVNASNVQLPVRILIYRGSAVLNGNMQFAKAAAVGIPLQITAWADTTKTAGQQLWTFQKTVAPKT
jgi:hypothetical protein